MTLDFFLVTPEKNERETVETVSNSLAVLLNPRLKPWAVC